MGGQKQIRVGIIGQGRSGRNIHGAHLCGDTARFRIAAVAELIGERRHRAAEEYGCDVYGDHREMLARSDLDLVINATYSHAHPDVTIECLNAGFDVLCEKPMAATLEDADRMIAASHSTGKLLTVFQPSRFSPAFQQILDVIQSGVLGRLVQISIASNGFSRRWDWQTLQSHRGGNMMNTGPHLLDQALHVFGDGTPRVHSCMDRANTFGDAEDYIKIVLSGSDRPVIDIESSSCCAFPSFNYNIQGTLGGLTGTTSELAWKYFRPQEAPAHQVTAEPICKEDGTPAYCSETLTWHTGNWAFDPSAASTGDAAYRGAANDLAPDKSRPQASSSFFATMAAAYYDKLYATLTSGAPLAITPEQVRRQMAVFELCREQNPEVYAQPKMEAGRCEMRDTG